MKRNFIVVLFIILCSCGQSQDSITNWVCKSRSLSFQLYKPWTKLPTLDTKEKTLTGVIDNSDGKSYIIQITEDIPQNSLGNKQYFEGVKQSMLTHNRNNVLISEDTVTFHKMQVHRQIYLIHTDKWGILKQINFVFRNGIEFISVQISFPVNEDAYAKDNIPYQLIQFDKTVKINSN